MKFIFGNNTAVNMTDFVGQTIHWKEVETNPPKNFASEALHLVCGKSKTIGNSPVGSLSLMK